MRLWRGLIIGLGLTAILGATTAGLVAMRFTTVHSAPKPDPTALQPEAPALVDDGASLLADQRAEQVWRAERRVDWDLSTWAEAAPALRPVEPRLPEPGAPPPRWQPLDQRVRAIAEASEGRLSVVAIDLHAGERYEFRPRDRYLPASTFKLPVVLCVVEAIGRGELTWESLVTFLPEDDDTVGQGGFATAPYGGQYTVRNLVDRSLISSNNVAVKMLARTLTFEGLGTCTAEIGGMVTRDEEGSTPVTALDEAAWWYHLWQMQQERPALAENLLGPLRRGTYWGRIQAGTPRPDLVTHKFGTYPPYENDGAIIWAEEPYILVVLTYGFDHLAVDGLIEQIAAAAWQGAR